MKILIVANNCKWKSWPKKVRELKKWFKPALDLDFEIIHTSYQDVPFIIYNYDILATGVDYAWYNTHVTALAEDHDIVLFVLNMKQWDSVKARGWRTDNDQGPVELSVGADENLKEQWPNFKRMSSFFQIARHEICHALYMLNGGIDNTHKYWDMGKLELCLNEFNIERINKVSLISRLKTKLWKLIAQLNRKV